MDSTHPITPYKNHSALFYNSLFNCKIFCHYRQIYPPKFQELPKVAEVATKLDLF